MSQIKNVISGMGILVLVLSLSACAPSSSATATPAPSETAVVIPTLQVLDTVVPTQDQVQPAVENPTLPPVISTLPAIPTLPPADSTLPAVNTPVAAINTPVGGSVPNNSTVADRAQYVTQNIADKSRVGPGATVTIIWNVKNSGTVGWTTDYTIRYFSGVRANQDFYNFSKAVAVGKTIDLSVTFKAPETPGTYNTWWKLTNAQNQNFSDVDFTFEVK